MAQTEDELVKQITDNEAALTRLREQEAILSGEQGKLLGRLKRLNYARWYLLNSALIDGQAEII